MERITLYKDGDGEFYCTWAEALNGWNLHSQINSWSLSRYKKYIKIFTKVLYTLHQQGIDKVYAVPPSESEEKWERLFGFEDSGVRTTEGYKVMERLTWA